MRIVIKRKLFGNAQNKALRRRWEVQQGALNDAKYGIRRADTVLIASGRVRTAQDKSIRGFRSDNKPGDILQKKSKAFEKAKARNDAWMRLSAEEKTAALQKRQLRSQRAAVIDPLANKKTRQVLTHSGNYTGANFDALLESRPDIAYFRNHKKYGGTINTHELNSYAKTAYGKNQVRGLEKNKEYYWDKNRKKWAEFKIEPTPKPPTAPVSTTPKPPTAPVSTTPKPPTAPVSTTPKPSTAPVNVPSSSGPKTNVKGSSAVKKASNLGSKFGKASLGILGTGALLYGAKKLYDANKEE